MTRVPYRAHNRCLNLPLCSRLTGGITHAVPERTAVHCSNARANLCRRLTGSVAALASRQSRSLRPLPVFNPPRISTFALLEGFLAAHHRRLFFSTRSATSHPQARAFAQPGERRDPSDTAADRAFPRGRRHLAARRNGRRRSAADSDGRGVGRPASCGVAMPLHYLSERRAERLKLRLAPR